LLHDYFPPSRDCSGSPAQARNNARDNQRADQPDKTKNTMSNQKSKFQLFSRLQALGFTYEESAQLRRIEMTLHRWAEAECGDENGNCIERDEATGKPFRTFERDSGPRGRYPIADREAGALRRMEKIVAARNLRAGDTVHAYHQGDCRGCMLYILRDSDVRPGEAINSVYTRGVAVCC
jgi:hypothetical protein